MSNGETKGQVQVIITFNRATSEISISGPVGDAVLFLGLLEMAKVAMLEQRERDRRVVLAPFRLPAKSAES